MGRSRSFCEVWERCMFTTVISSCFAHASMQFRHLCLDPFRILPPILRRCERQLRPIAEICIIRMGFSSPPSLFGNICGGIYSRSELRRRSGGASYTKIGGRFGCLPCGAFSDTLIQGECPNCQHSIACLIFA